MRAVMVLLVLAAGCLSAAGCASAENAIPRTPYFAEVPSPLPVATPRAGGCEVSGTPPLQRGAGASLVAVSPHPLSLTVLQIAGPSGPCVMQIDVGPTTADRLATLVDEMTPFPPGIFHCPSDSGAFTALYFHYGQASPSELVEVLQSGCGGITAPAHGYGVSPDLGDFLASLEKA